MERGSDVGIPLASPRRYDYLSQTPATSNVCNPHSASLCASRPFTRTFSALGSGDRLRLYASRHVKLNGPLLVLSAATQLNLMPQACPLVGHGAVGHCAVAIEADLKRA